MESEVNVYYKELFGPKPGYQLLTNQLQRLCVVLDVYLETESHDNSVEGPKEFPQEKMCLRLVRYGSARLPLCLMPSYVLKARPERSGGWLGWGLGVRLCTASRRDTSRPPGNRNA